MKITHWVLSLAPAILLASVVNASDMEFLDLSKVDRDLLGHMRSFSPTKMVGIERDLAALKDLDKASAKLDVDAKHILSLVKPSNDLVLAPKLFVLPVAGDNVEFVIVDVVWDAAFQTNHLAAVSTSHPGDYIRYPSTTKGTV